MNETTRLALAVETGGPQAAERLLPLVYDELRRLAFRRLEREQVPARRSRQRLWFMRPICGWSAATRSVAGTAGGTSPPRPRPCAASLSTAHRDRRRLSRGGEQGRVDFDLGSVPRRPRRRPDRPR